MSTTDTDVRTESGRGDVRPDGLVAPLLMQTVFTAVVGAVDPKGGDSRAEALILGSFAVAP